MVNCIALCNFGVTVCLDFACGSFVCFYVQVRTSGIVSNTSVCLVKRCIGFCILSRLIAPMCAWLCVFPCAQDMWCTFASVLCVYVYAFLYSTASDGSVPSVRVCASSPAVGHGCVWSFLYNCVCWSRACRFVGHAGRYIPMVVLRSLDNYNLFVCVSDVW